ncbi:MAG TPA: hypothetical protein VJ843_03600 [Candidatus Saccharimonadales bacterium]|nr:hypothetical protein [Candidatus Saccharimonadales bacterium]
MHITQAALEYLAYTPSNKHFGMNNTTFFTVVFGGIGLVIFLLTKKK